MNFDREANKEHGIIFNGERFFVKTSDFDPKCDVFGDGHVLIPSILRSRGIEPDDWDNEYIKMISSISRISGNNAYLSPFGVDIPSMAKFAWGMYRLTSEVEQVAPMMGVSKLLSGPSIRDPFYETQINCTKNGIEIQQYATFAGKTYSHHAEYRRNEELESIYGLPMQLDEITPRGQLGVLYEIMLEVQRYVPSCTFIDNINNIKEIFFPLIIFSMVQAEKDVLREREKEKKAGEKA